MEQLQLLIQDLAVSLPIHHFPRLEELQPAPPPPAEAAPDHDLGRVLHTLPGELGVEPVRPLASPAAPALLACPQLKMALVTKHHLFPILHSPVLVPSGKLEPVVLHPLGDERLVRHLAAGQLQLILAEHLDAADTDILQMWDVLLELPGCDAGVPHQPLLHLPNGTEEDFGGSAGILALLWNGGLWMCFDIGQNIPQASLTHLQMVPDVFE